MFNFYTHVYSGVTWHFTLIPLEWWSCLWAVSAGCNQRVTSIHPNGMVRYGMVWHGMGCGSIRTATTCLVIVPQYRSVSYRQTDRHGLRYDRHMNCYSNIMCCVVSHAFILPCPLHVPVLSPVSCPMCYPKGRQVSCGATLTAWATDNNAPVQLVHSLL